MSCPRLVPLLLWVLLPLQGFAQDPSAPPLVPAPSAPEPAPSEPEEGDPYGGYDDEPAEEPRGEIIPREWARTGMQASNGGRIALSVLVGTVLEVAAVIPGSVMMLDAAFCEGCSDTGEQLLAGIALTLAGLSLGPTLAIVGVGGLMDGRGRFLPTLVGSLLGTGVGLVVGIALAYIVGPFALVPILAGPVIGGVIGYERSHDQAGALGQEVHAGARVVPIVSVRPSGGLVAGLVGQF